MKPQTIKQRPVLRENRASMRDGFTLIELLVVIGIIAVLASIAIPSMKGFGSTNAISAANRQLLQDLEFARLRALNERTTVYVVFISTNLATAPASARAKWKSVNETRQAQRLLSGQLTTYALFARRSLGDQPGRGTLRYLTEWKSLPDGVMIAPNKFVFTSSGSVPNSTTTRWADWLGQPGHTVTNWPFQYSASFPFPMEASDPLALGDMGMPYIAFNYQGRLVQATPNPHDEFISLVRGSIIFGTSDAQGAENSFGTAAEVIETPKGNSENSPVIHIDWLTGRARSETRSF